MPVDNSFFFVEAGLCGMGQLNFYKQDDGTWKFYVDNGDGTLQGTCFQNQGRTTCPAGKVYLEQLVCYSNICD